MVYIYNWCRWTTTYNILVSIKENQTTKETLKSQRKNIMKLLQYANWKQKLPFDNLVYREVKSFSLRLNSYEREIMDMQIDFYRNNFSLLQIMNYFKILKTQPMKESFIKQVLKRQEQILYLPPCLKQHFKTKIKNEFSEYSSFFEIMLEKALSQSEKNIYLPIVKAIMGGFYKPVLKQIKSYKKMPRLQLKSIASYENLARMHIYNLQNDIVLTSIYGRSSIRKTVPISIVDDYGYGEWISKHVTFNTNRLFIYSNNNKLTDAELEHMIYLNVYPGYGYFYNTIFEGNPKICFDNGATYLINGWAMYSMCHSRNSAYSTTRLSEASKIIFNLLNKNLQHGYEETFTYLLGEYPRAKAIEYMLDYTQYPGHYMSYVMGAFAIEQMLLGDFANNPKTFLDNLKGVNCGDFFALYTPKMQKQISKTNIVAKVFKKYE